MRFPYAREHVPHRPTCGSHTTTTEAITTALTTTENWSHTSAWHHHPDYGVTLLADRCRNRQDRNTGDDDDPYLQGVGAIAAYMAHAG